MTGNSAEASGFLATLHSPLRSGHITRGHTAPGVAPLPPKLLPSVATSYVPVRYRKLLNGLLEIVKLMLFDTSIYHRQKWISFAGLYPQWINYELL